MEKPSTKESKKLKATLLNIISSMNEIYTSNRGNAKAELLPEYVQKINVIIDNINTFTIDEITSYTATFNTFLPFLKSRSINEQIIFIGFLGNYIDKIIHNNANDTISDQNFISNSEIDQMIKERINTILNEQKTQITSTLNSNIRELEDTITSTKEKINDLKSSYEEAKQVTNNHIEIETKNTFNYQNKILSEQFDKKRIDLEKQKKPYQSWAITLTILLWVIYGSFFITNHKVTITDTTKNFYISKIDTCKTEEKGINIYKIDTNKISSNSINTTNTGNILNFNYFDHLMLMGICSPFIFLIIWLFCQVGRFNHLIEVYTHKANIGFTLKAAIDHIHNIEGDDNNKSTTLTTLHELLNKLYESPISTKDNESITTKSLSQITELLKEVKELVNTIKPTSDKTNT